MEFLSCDGSEDEYRLQKTIRVHTGAWTFAFGKNIDKKSQRSQKLPWNVVEVSDRNWQRV